MRLAAIAIFVVLTSVMSTAQTREAAFEMNERLGRGINMGNSFEAPTETAWGNPWKPEYFKIMSELGFNHVRLPVRWETPERTPETPPYTIAPSFLDRIQAVVDTALKYKLHIIVNMHHHDALFDDPAGQKDRFIAQWAQIADHFKDYPDSLLFEVMNEPHGNLTPALWNEYFADALAEIRNTNPTRFVLIGTANYGGLASIPELQLPDDEYIILTAHYYNPFTFTHQGAEWVSGADAWLGTQWLDTAPERETVESEFNYALHFSETQHIPLHVGEFGAYSSADAASRKRWTTFLARWFEQKNLSWAYWEFSAGFGIYNPATEQYHEDLVDALLHDEMPEATPIVATPIYNSNFSGLDGWQLIQQGGAAGTLAASGGKLNVAITAGGTETWHLQLIKNNIRLEKDKLYKISFTAQAEADRSVTFYAGKASSPWNSYSSTSAVTLSTSEATFSSTFTMTSATDPAARLVFDLGLNVSDVSISNVSVEELSFVVTNVEGESLAASVQCYPNPASSRVNLAGLAPFSVGSLIDMRGLTHFSFPITTNKKELDIEHLPAGLYVLLLSGRTANAQVKIVKR